MSQEDNELEKLKATRLAEMEKNLSSQRQQKKLQSSQEEEKKNQPTHREIVVKRLGYRGLEVLQNAEYQFPKETQIVIQKLAELISSGDIKEVLDGGQLFALIRSIGINVRMKTKISVEKDGKFVSISDKLRTKSPSTKSD